MNLSSQKILLVDDNPKNLQVAMNILKEYNVLYAQSGDKALKLVGENDFDLILLDVVMPGMNGYEVCEQLKSNEDTKNIPIIFLTVKDDEKDIVEGFELGAVDYIVKPFYSEVLLKRVELHLKLSSSINDLKDLNENLNDLVQRQIEDIRKKDEILFRQSKILALNDMADMMSEQLTNPLGLIKLQNQALEIKNISGILKEEDIDQIINANNKQLNDIDIILNDFKSFFQQDTKPEFMNLNVMLDRAVLFFKESFIKNSIDFKIKGDNNLRISFVRSELKHILIKLISTIIYLFEENKVLNKKKIKFIFEDKIDYVELEINSNVGSIEDCKLQGFFNQEIIVNQNSKDSSLGFHLVKMLMEKNLSDIKANTNETGISYLLKFYK